MDRATGLYSCDDHIDMRAVPRDLWSSRLPASLRERGPRVVKTRGVLSWVCGDRVLGGTGIPRMSRAKFASLTAIGRAGIEDDGFRASDPKLRLEDMDRDGLWVSVIYGPGALGLPIDDPVVQEAACVAWNDWAIEEFNAVDPDRLCVLPYLPTHSPEAAARELERCAAAGHRGAVIDVFSIDAGDRAWERLWAAAEASGLPLSFHLQTGTWSNLSYRFGKWQSAAFASVLPLQLDEPLATMLFSGALERHPGLRLVMAEIGVGWLPYFLWRMDNEWHMLKDKLDDVATIAPSELFRRQVIAAFEDDALAPDAIPQIGADSCMWASDYPHTDSTFPHSRDAVEEMFGALPEEDRRKITVTNCARLYGFEVADG